MNLCEFYACTNWVIDDMIVVAFLFLTISAVPKCMLLDVIM